MTKVQILTECEACQGQAYLPVGEAESYTGEPYLRFQPCYACQSSGTHEKWVTLGELAQMLSEAVSPQLDLMQLSIP